MWEIHILAQRAVTANLRAVLNLAGEAHSFGIPALSSHSQESSGFFEPYSDP
jgi:hypothetical protein